jgi:hypothetical protein
MEAEFENGGTLARENGLQAGRWTLAEKQGFVDGLNTFGRDWRKISQLVKTRR